MRGDAEVSELEVLALAHEHIERSEIAVQRLTTVQRIERSENRRELTSDEALALRALSRQPGTEVTVLGVLHHQAVTHSRSFNLGEAIEDAQRSWLSREQFGEVGFAQPSRESVADLDAHLRRQIMRRARCREVDLAKSTAADQSMAMQVGGDRMLAVTGALPPDSLRAMIRRINAEMRSK